MLVSIKPLYSLVAGVMDGVGAPALILTKNPRMRRIPLSVDEFALLKRGSVVFWTGLQLEPWMEGPLTELRSKIRSVPLLKTRGLRLMEALPGRKPRPSTKPKTAKPNGRSTVAIPRDGGTGAPATKPTGQNTAVRPRNRALTVKDLTPRKVHPHVWLDPRNAITLVRHISRVLEKADPANASKYRINAARLIVRIETTDSDLTAQLRGLPKARFLTFDKAFQYFETHYLLHAAGRLQLHPRKLTAKNIQAARSRLTQDSSRCVFASTAYDRRVSQSMMVRTNRLVQIDPYGARVGADIDAWFKIMRAMATAYARCLDPRRRKQ